MFRACKKAHERSGLTRQFLASLARYRAHAQLQILNRAHGGVELCHDGGANHMMEPAVPITSWGIQCRTCNESILLGTKLDSRYADFLSFLRPGSFRCMHGHTFNYDSDDVCFFSSFQETPETEAEMEKNRANYTRLAP